LDRILGGSIGGDEVKRLNKYCRSKRKDIIRYLIECRYRIECWTLEEVERGYENSKARRTADKVAKLRDWLINYSNAVAKVLPEVEDVEKRELFEEMLKVLDKLEYYFSYIEYAKRKIISRMGKIINISKKRVKRLERLLDYTGFEHCWCIRIPDVVDENGCLVDKDKFEKIVELLDLYVRGGICLEDFELIIMSMIYSGELGRFEFLPLEKALILDEEVLKHIFIRKIIKEFEKLYGRLTDGEKERLKRKLSRFPAVRLEGFWYAVEYFRLSKDEFIRKHLASEYL